MSVFDAIPKSVCTNNVRLSMFRVFRPTPQNKSEFAYLSNDPVHLQLEAFSVTGKRHPRARKPSCAQSKLLKEVLLTKRSHTTYSSASPGHSSAAIPLPGNPPSICVSSSRQSKR